MRVPVFATRVLVPLIGFALPLGAACPVRAVTLSSANLTGQWMFQMVPVKSFTADAPSDPGGIGTAPRQDLLRVGTLRFDGSSFVEGRILATTDDNAGNTVIIDYALSGTYTVNANGTGTMSVTPTVTDLSCTPAQAAGVCATFEGPETYALTVTRNRGLSLTQTDNAGGGAKIFMMGRALRQSTVFDGPPLLGVSKLKSSWAFTMVPAKSFTADAPLDPGGIATAPRQDILRVGQMNFNGAGGVSGNTVATTDDNSGNTVIVEFNWAGNYFVNSDGTGTLTMTPEPISDANCTPTQPPGDCATFEGAETYSLAIVPKRRRIYFTQTDNAGSGAKIFLAGEANYQ